MDIKASLKVTEAMCEVTKIGLTNGDVFYIAQNLEDLNISVGDTIDEWLKQTKDHTAESLCDYIQGLDSLLIAQPHYPDAVEESNL